MLVKIIEEATGREVVFPCLRYVLEKVKMADHASAVGGDNLPDNYFQYGSLKDGYDSGVPVVLSLDLYDTMKAVPISTTLFFVPDTGSTLYIMNDQGKTLNVYK